MIFILLGIIGCSLNYLYLDCENEMSVPVEQKFPDKSRNGVEGYCGPVGYFRQRLFPGQLPRQLWRIIIASNIQVT